MFLQKIVGIIVMSISLDIQETSEGKCALRQGSNLLSVFKRNIMVRCDLNRLATEKHIDQQCSITRLKND